MELNEEDNIRWQKLEEQLDQPSIDPEQSGLTGEERSVLLFFKRLRARLRPVDPDRSFPVNEGWESLVQRIGNEDIDSGSGTRVVRLFRYKLAAAAVLLLLAAGAFWWFASGGNKGTTGLADNRDSVQRAIQPPTGDVQLVLADGRKLNLGKRQSITETNGVSIDATEEQLVYGTNAGASNEVLYNTLIVPRGKKSQVKLPDGTQVWLNAESRLKFPVSFSGITREVTVDGEAYFDVEKNENKPFIVHSGRLQVEVLGTSFNIKAYDRTVYTTLEKGKVRVKDPNTSIVLVPGEQARVNTETGASRKAPVFTRLFTGWKDGELYLEDQSLADIAVMLSRSYDYEFEFEDSSLKDIRFTVDIAAPDNLQAVLDHISSTTEGLRFTVSGRVVRVSR